MKIILDVSEYQSLAQLDGLLTNGPDEIVGVYIKATQGLTYKDEMAAAFAAVCIKHDTAFGYYDFMTNDQAADQAREFLAFVGSLPKPGLKPMMDCEGAYQLYAAGVEHEQQALRQQVITYAQLSNMPKYVDLNTPKWVAQYDQRGPYTPQPSEISAYKDLGYVLWQYTSAYNGMNQDASVLLLDSLDPLRI